MVVNFAHSRNSASAWVFKFFEWAIVKLSKLINKRISGSSFFPESANATKMFVRQVSFFICFCQISKIFLHKFSPKTRYDTEEKKKNRWRRGQDFNNHKV